MESMSDSSLLCVDSKAGGCKIKVEKLDQSTSLEEVSSFGIVPQQEYSFEVCQNQEAAPNESAAEIKPTIKSEIWIENVKVELSSSDSEELVEPTDSNSAENTNRLVNWRSKEERDKQDQFIKEHFRLACPLCDKSVRTFQQIRLHFRKIHDRRDAFVRCCDRKFSKRCHLLDHLRGQFHEIFSCVLCSENFMTTQALSTHLIDGQGRFTCEECSLSFKQKCALDTHKTHHCKPRCLECDVVFDTSHSLASHTELQHNGVDPALSCETCGQRFRGMRSLKVHVNSQHLGIKYPTFQCEICQRWLKSERNYRDHMNGVHGPNKDERKVQCEICLKIYSNKKALVTHKLNVHVEPKFECDFCGAKFKRKLNLKEHRSIHTDTVARQLRCEFCEYKCKNSSCWYKHMKKHHPEERANRGSKPLQGSIVD